ETLHRGTERTRIFVRIERIGRIDGRCALCKGDCSLTHRYLNVLFLLLILRRFGHAAYRIEVIVQIPTGTPVA
uniref:Uncharacterized protein n=1 Tax=Anopheles minimus TaxID=112268 RepID=A0A182WNH6_9DIPT